MPTYAYRCPRGHKFDRFQKISARPGAKCPECGRRAQRVITGGVGLLFKGSGFYATDYKRTGEARDDQAKKEKGGSEGAATSSTEPPEKGSKESQADRPKKDVKDE